MPVLFTNPLPRLGSRPQWSELTPGLPSVSSETSGLQATTDHETRKRSRYDNPHSRGDASTLAPHSPSADALSHTLSYSRSSIRSPPPLANERYELAGGMEVTDKFARHNDGNYDDYFHLKKQREMWSTPTSPQAGVPPRAQLADLQATAEGPRPWMLNQLMSIVGGVAGKLYQFCAVPFRGFQAGGGQAYTFEGQGVAATTSCARSAPGKSVSHGLHQEPSQEETKNAMQQSWTSQYSENDYGVLSMESLDNDSERPRNKRQRTGENWVVVNDDGGMVSRPSTPRIAARRLPGHAKSSPSQIPRPVSRASAATPVHMRPSLIPVSRRSTLDRRSSLSSAGKDCPPYGGARSYSRQSYGSPVMFNRNTTKKSSPLPVESQRLINKMRHEEDEDDARMRRMSSQMSAMLREAQEALGSKVELSDDYMDEELHSNTTRLFPQ